MRVLKWIVDRVRGRALAKETRDRVDAPLRGPRLDADWISRRTTFDELQSVDTAAWKREVMDHEELFIELHNHLPPEMIYERELLICRL